MVTLVLIYGQSLLALLWKARIKDKRRLQELRVIPRLLQICSDFLVIIPAGAWRIVALARSNIDISCAKEKKKEEACEEVKSMEDKLRHFHHETFQNMYDI